MKFGIAALIGGILLPAVSFAQDMSIITDVESGNWVALHHSPDQGVRTDICLAASGDEGLLFRADAHQLEIRTGNPQWSMTVGQQGEMTVNIGAYSHTFQMIAEGASMLTTLVQPEDMKALLDAMDNAGQVTLKYGQKTTRVVSLAGSTKALNQFRSCVESNGFADVGKAAGSNASPF
ncbi:hypothetical protein K6L44_06470 [Gluconacetobacter entanii]|uniref:hypothetical protein n=1 Tax=Gluconacetobacter entanii TaxID=108528 RepID=UPI001C932096|nr:hypothetical protein [Gluconacetobacter entanii]MBY4639645.1 hypothetical protein [Gluconacetobacter entanii]MCW4579659.1 hypothetical protein [Gluconacetobacter entanii]MCW4583065.1 hypothetical protein [Gluconacetobacter entanii]MCW4586430.1 hypothetical protein [Gluconacetobacter entanii]